MPPFHRIALATFIFASPLPAKTLVVSRNHPQASDDSPGTPEAPFKTISKAAGIANPGDTILVHSGTYRERVTPARGGTSGAPITYQAAPGETVIIKGSEIWNPSWKTIDEARRILEAPLDPSLFPDANPYLKTISVDGGDKSTASRPAKDGHYPETLGQIFVDGHPYQQAANPVMLGQTDGSWLVGEKGDTILINLRQNEVANPEVELTVRDRIFSPAKRALQHIAIRGFIFEHCANQGPFPQGGAISTRSGKHWIIEENTIRHAKTIGLDCGSETWDANGFNIPTADEDKKLIIGGNHLIRNNTISDNGLCGIAGWNHQGTRVVGNLLERNNTLGFPRGKGWEEWAAIKFHNADALIEGNIIRDNEAHGIWMDNGYANARITRNVIVNNLLSGIFIELGTARDKRILISNNIIAHTRSGGGFYNGSGIYTHDASDIDIAHNLLFANAGYGVTIRAITPREHGGGVAGGNRNRILNNIIASNSLGQLSLPAPSEITRDNQSDHNFFLPGPNGNSPDFHINVFHNPFDWKKAIETFTPGISGIPETKRPDPASLSRNPSLHFEAWQIFSGLDKNSIRAANPKGHGFAVRTRIPELQFPGIEALASMKAPRLPEVTEDFEGNPLPDAPVTPGPFIGGGKTERLISLDVRQ